MINVTLNNGVEMPILGFGVFQIADLKECEKCVNDAIEVGYRLIDTAAAYQNEEAVGAAIKNSGVPRKDLFITTKLWIKKNGYDETMFAFEDSLKKLQLDYLDLYLIHQPYGDVYGEWRAMEALHKDGLIRSIGVSNFHPDRLIDLINFNEIKPAINQIETNPFQQQIVNHELLINNQVQTQSWAPFAEGRNEMFQNQVLQNIGLKYQKSIAQVILRWLIQRGIVVIPKTIQKSRMAENIDIFDFTLSEEDMEDIKQLDVNQSSFFDHRDPEIVKWMGTYKR
jgi:diketogulonate reductase-like aldo/keto reductase